LAMGDTLFDIAVQMSTEGRVPPAEPRPGLFEWLQPKAVACFDLWESEAANYGRFDIGHVGMLQGISYSASAYVSRAEEPLYPDFDWRAARPHLAAWYDKVIQRPSVQAYLNKPFRGDMSPGFHQQQVQAVLNARRTA